MGGRRVEIGEQQGKGTEARNIQVHGDHQELREVRVVGGREQAAGSAGQMPRGGQWVISEEAWPLPGYSIAHKGIPPVSWLRASVYGGILLEGGSLWSKLIPRCPLKGHFGHDGAHAWRWFRPRDPPSFKHW